jgi:hypothetical protein
MMWEHAFYLLLGVVLGVVLDDALTAAVTWRAFRRWQKHGLNWRPPEAQ